MGNVPAYVIYPDRTLRNLSLKKPKTEEDLLQVRGIGPAKAAKFGVETLSIIRSISGE
jgi:ATP-dependent DNA helicase RecQ